LTVRNGLTFAITELPRPAGFHQVSCFYTNSLSRKRSL